MPFQVHLISRLGCIAVCLLATVGYAETKPTASPETKPAPRAARSVHLWWNAPEGTDFYNEMSIEQSTRGSYFMACGFSHGYFGMQSTLR